MKWIVEAGRMSVSVGASSEDIRKFDIVKKLDDEGNNFTVAGWRKYGYDNLIIDFVKFDGKSAYLSEDYYPEYYNKSIDYYNKMLNDMLKYGGPTHFAWYGMVRTEIRSGTADW
jgi:hypothetical protein